MRRRSHRWTGFAQKPDFFVQDADPPLKPRLRMEVLLDDKGIGGGRIHRKTLGRHRRLFAEMNHIEANGGRRLLACPDIPEARFAELREAGIKWRIVPLPAQSASEPPLSEPDPQKFV